VSFGGPTKPLDGSVVNASVDAAAEIDVSKLAPGTEGQTLQTVGGVPTWQAATGGGGGFTRTAVTGDVTVPNTNASDWRDVTDLSGGDIAITLAAANGGTVEQQLVTDSTGVAQSDGVIEIIAAGSDTISIPGLAKEYSRIVLVNNYGSVLLHTDGTSKWSVTSRSGCGVSPRCISGIFAWHDSVRGVSTTSTSVTGLADQSGNSVDLAQASAGSRPQWPKARTTTTPRMAVGPRDFIWFDNSNDFLTSPNHSVSSGALMGVAVAFKQWDGAVGGTNTNYFCTLGFTSAGSSWATAGFALTETRLSSVDFSVGGLNVWGDGFNGGQAPRANTPTVSGPNNDPNHEARLTSFRVGATETYIRHHKGLGPMELVKANIDGAVPTLTNQPYTIGGEALGTQSFDGSIGLVITVDAEDDDDLLALEDLALQMYWSG
jgi:hypothetical protein